MDKISIGLGFLLVLLPSLAFSASSTGTITTLRATTDHEQQSAHERRVMLFKISGGHSSSCPWLSLKEGNSYFASTLLSAQARGKSVQVWYVDEPVVGTCEVNTIQVNE